jgi:hypothetical protein
MSTLQSSSDDYKMIEKLIQNGKGSRNLTLVDCFKIERDGEDKIFNP